MKLFRERERELMNLQTKVSQKKFVLVKLTGYQKKIDEYGKEPYRRGVVSWAGRRTGTGRV